MDGNVKPLYDQIIRIAKENHAAKIVLFGSRARGTQTSKSDIDLAIYGCDDFTKLYFELNEKLWTLLKLDIINMDAPGLSPELAEQIEREGIVLYEEVS